MPRRRMPQPGEKADLKSFWKLLSYCRSYLPAIVIAMAFAVGGTVCTLIGPEKMKDLTDIIQKGILAGIDMDAFVKVCVFLVTLYAIGAFLSYGQQFIMATVTQNVSKKLRSSINRKINLLPLNYFDTTTKGDILSRVTNDVDTISQTLSQSTANLVSAIALFVGVLFMMFKTNAVLAIVTIGSSVLGFILMFCVLRVSQKYFNRVQDQIGDINGDIEEVYTNHNIVKAYNGRENERAKFRQLNLKLFDSNWKAQFLSSLMMPIMTFVGHLSYVLIFVIGTVFIVNGNSAVTIGTLISFTMYARLFSQPLSTIGQSMTSIQSASAASRRVFAMIEGEEMSDESEKTTVLEKVEGNVTFKHVKFGYSPDKTIIHDFSADLKKGQKVAIVGPTGAGKTTMVNLLMRFYEIAAPRLIVNGEITDYKIFDNGRSIRLSVGEDGALSVNGAATEFSVSGSDLPRDTVFKFDQDFDVLSGDEMTDIKLPVLTGRKLNHVEGVSLGVAYYGDIFVDHIPVNAMKREAVHDLFDMILQDTWLFEGTVRENLVYNKQGVTDKELDMACAAVGLTHFIKCLPQGYDTVLNEGSSLSEGQKQQFTIARAIIKDAPLLILDEATSNIDTRTELVIQEAMDKLTENRTSFVIAHRLSTIRNADVILVMRDGDIVEQGDHEELMAKNGFYAEIYNSQFEQIA